MNELKKDEKILWNEPKKERKIYDNNSIWGDWDTFLAAYAFIARKALERYGNHAIYIRSYAKYICVLGASMVWRE